MEDAPPNSNHFNAFNELSRHLGTPNKINATDVASFRYLFCGFRLQVVPAPPPVTTHYHAYPSHGPPSVCLARTGSRTRPDPSQHQTSVE